MPRQRSKCIAVVLGAGVGSRLGMDIPKQLVKVSGSTLLEHTITRLEASRFIDEIVVMITPGWSERVAAMLSGRFAKVQAILEGGESRTDTTRRALEWIEEEEGIVLFHDAVRPFVDDRILEDCVKSLEEYGAVDVVIPTADTIVEVNADGTVSTIPDRASLRRGQTPQGFRLAVIRRAYERAQRDPGFTATDDCGVVARYCSNERIATVLGSEDNFKITHPIDLVLADRVFQLRTMEPPNDSGTLNLAGRTIVVLGGSYGIGAEIVRLGREFGANMVSHSRSATGFDLTSTSAVERVLAEVVRNFGQIDSVVVTAGLLKLGALTELSDRDVNALVNVNYQGPIRVARAAYKYLAESRGSLVFFASSSYTRGRSNYAIYSSSKAGVVNLAQALADEWAETGVRVNVVNPERTATPMRAEAFGVEEPETLLSAEQVAMTALRVVKSQVTGAVIDVRRG